MMAKLRSCVRKLERKETDATVFYEPENADEAEQQAQHKQETVKAEKVALPLPPRKRLRTKTTMNPIRVHVLVRAQC